MSTGNVKRFFIAVFLAAEVIEMFGDKPLREGLSTPPTWRTRTLYTTNCSTSRL